VDALVDLLVDDLFGILKGSRPVSTKMALTVAPNVLASITAYWVAATDGAEPSVGRRMRSIL